MTKLSKIFRRENISRIDDTEIEIEVDYDPSDNSISNLRVNAFNYHQRNMVDLTPVFSHFPEFDTVVDNIDWAKEYSDYQVAQAEKEEEVYSD